MLANDLVMAVLNLSIIQDYLDDYQGNKAIFYGYVAPNDFVGNNYILYYYDTIEDNEYKTYIYMLNCRSDELQNSIKLATTIREVANRLHISDGYVLCTQLATVEPKDVNDVYNTPVKLIIKRRA